VIDTTAGLFNYCEDDYKIISSIKMYNSTLKSVCPDNLVLLKNKKIFSIEKIMIKLNKYENVITEEQIFILGHEMINKREAFNYPFSSEQIGVFIVDGLKECHELISIKMIQHKCILLNVRNKQYAVTLLHF
jgi:hypothetical protein